jgi:hypothetical protein
MSLSNYSNRELVKELASRKDFAGCVIHYSRPLGSPVQDDSQAMIVLSKQMDSTKAISLLKAAVRAMERAANDSAARTTDNQPGPSELAPKVVLKNQ